MEMKLFYNDDLRIGTNIVNYRNELGTMADGETFVKLWINGEFYGEVRKGDYPTKGEMEKLCYEFHEAHCDDEGESFDEEFNVYMEKYLVNFNDDEHNLEEEQYCDCVGYKEYEFDFEED